MKILVTAVLGCLVAMMLACGGDGANGTSCTVQDNGDGTATITCEDGTSVIVDDGTPGGSCTIQDNGDGTKTITCDDGTSVVIGDGSAGAGLVVEVLTSAPANGTHFTSGEQIVITIVYRDGVGLLLGTGDLSQARLYMNGPRDVKTTTSSAALLNASTDRSASSHHYINLLDDPAPANLVVNGNTLVYTTETVTTEEPGTYTIGVRGVSAVSSTDRVFGLVDVQIGTATVEPLIVGNCADCHLGAASGKTYLHHIDNGSYEIDSDPVRTCKQCHNQEGYSAVRKCDDDSKAVRVNGIYTCEDGTENWSYMNDPIVRRVHGVHNGAHLSSNFNTNPTYGDFGDYLNLHFPALERCTKCHLDSSWEDNPSRLACGACHDNLDFVTGTFVPPTASTTICTINADCVGAFSGFDGICNTISSLCELQTHTGGSATDDTGCTTCHTSGGLADIAVAHQVAPVTYPQTLAVSMTAPANGSYYVAGEAPLVTIVVSEGGTPIDHTAMTSANFGSAYLFVNGPRSRRIPQLTTAARAETTTTIAGDWDLSATTGNLEVQIGNTQFSITPTRAVTTPTVAAAWLNGDPGFSAVAFAGEDGSNLTIMAKPSPRQSNVEILPSDVATVMGLATGVYSARSRSGSYAGNPYYQGYTYSDGTVNDPKVTWTAGNVEYQLDDVATAEPGTYSLWVRTGGGGQPNNWELINFQVGTAAVEAKVATNCADCHGDLKGRDGFHGLYEFNPDVCGSCHDYRRQYDDAQPGDPADGWGIHRAGTRSNAGFGAAPFSRRIHGVHFGNYVNDPYAIHASWGEAFSHIIFPQDVRNCTKCHSDSDSWSQKPSRVACLACHDSDSATAHGNLMTYDLTPWDAYNGDEQESCETCHGAGKDFAPDVVHNIWDPYVSPYPR